MANTTINELMQTDSREWDMDVLGDLFNERDRLLIQQMPLSNRYIIDTWYWIEDEKGEFTVRSYYRQIRGEQTCMDRIF